MQLKKLKNSLKMENKIYKEILEIAPTLASLDKQNPFKVPEGYFSTLENRTLDAMDKKSVLAASTPFGYFDNLSNKVLERVQSETEVKIIPLYKRRWLAIAASFLVLFGAGYLITTQSQHNIINDEFAFEIEAEEALDYLLENDNLYLSDLLTLDIYEDDISGDESIFTDMNDIDLEELLSELDQEDLEELL